jgi:uncharacterized membrane protein
MSQPKADGFVMVQSSAIIATTMVSFAFSAVLTGEYSTSNGVAASPFADFTFFYHKQVWSS